MLKISKQPASMTGANYISATTRMPSIQKSYNAGAQSGKNPLFDLKKLLDSGGAKAIANGSQTQRKVQQKAH